PSFASPSCEPRVDLLDTKPLRVAEQRVREPVVSHEPIHLRNAARPAFRELRATEPWARLDLRFALVEHLGDGGPYELAKLPLVDDNEAGCHLPNSSRIVASGSHRAAAADSPGSRPRARRAAWIRLA